MSCCPNIVPGLTNVNLSTSSGYLATRQSVPALTRGTTITLGAKVGNMGGTSPSLAISLWQSFDGGGTFKQSGSATNVTATGVTECAFTGLTAGMYMIQLVLTGTSAFCDVNIMVNSVTP